LLGDSFAMGDGVERGELFADVLENLLPKTEVVNLGVSGYGTDQELLTYLRRGRQYRPDVVLLPGFREAGRAGRSHLSSRRFPGAGWVP
jgi:hypothetical protein